MNRRLVLGRPTVYLVRGRRVQVHPICNSLPDHVFVRAVPRKGALGSDLGSGLWLVDTRELLGDGPDPCAHHHLVVRL